MPWSPKPACRYRQCPARATTSGYCDQHKQERRRYKNGSTTKHLYDWKWHQYSKRRLREHPLCEECRRQGRIAAAGATDHVIPHRGNMTLFWDAANHQSLCLPCHNAKSAREVLFRGGA